MLTDACTRALSALWEAAFALRSARVRAHPGSGLYRPRSPRSSPLWQCAKRHAGELRESGRMRREIEGQVIERFVACGDPREGFARIYCDACRHEYLLAYVQDPIFLPELPPEARAALRRVGRAQRARAGGTSAVRVHAAQAAAPDFQPAPGVAGRVVPYRCAAAGRCVRRSRPGRPPGPDPVRADLRGPGQLQSAPACACRRRRVRRRGRVHRAAGGARSAACRGLSARGA